MDGNFVTRREYEEHNLRMDDEHHRTSKRLDVIEKAIEQNNKLLISVERLAVSMEGMQKEQKDQGERLEVLEGRDGEMWRKVAGHVITAIISIILGFVFAKYGI